MTGIEPAAPIATTCTDVPLPISSSMWQSLLQHVAQHGWGIHMVYGKAGVGVPFVAEALEKVALAAGYKVASQEMELVNPSNWRHAVKLSRTGHVVIVRLSAPSTEALHAKYESLLRATAGDLKELRSHVFVKRANPPMTEPRLNELQLFGCKEDPTRIGSPPALR